MKIKERIKEYSFAIVFLTIVFGLGIPSFVKLSNFYINDEQEYSAWKPESGNKFESDIANNFFGKYAFVDMNGAVAASLHQPTMNGVIKLRNGRLEATLAHVSDITLGRYADNTVAFKDYLAKRGTDLLYVATPVSSSKYDHQLPTGVEYWTNDNIDRFAYDLKFRGVDMIDIREKMHEDGIDQYDMMYKTDHHWTTRAGLYVYGILEDYIVEKRNCEVDERIADIENYDIAVYEKFHLGSRGRRTGYFYGGADDFEVITPKFETSLKKPDGTKGTMPELMYDMKPLEKKDYTSRYIYDSVLIGTLGHYINENSKNDVKILIISDSFARPVTPYLAMGFKEVRYEKDNDVSKITPEMIEEYDPDVVIMMYYALSLQENRKDFAFDSFKTEKK